MRHGLQKEAEYEGERRQHGQGDGVVALYTSISIFRQRVIWCDKDAAVLALTPLLVDLMHIAQSPARNTF